MSARRYLAHFASKHVCSDELIWINAPRDHVCPDVSAVRHARDRAFVQAFWNLHRESIVAKRDPCTEKYCPLFVTARRHGVAV